jgi:hypothetical protein
MKTKKILKDKEDKLMNKIQEVVIDWEFAGSSKVALNRLRKLLK